MTEIEKLESSILKIDELTSLLKDNVYQDHLYSHLLTIGIELKRQLTNLQHHSKIKE
jgi:hypothetical protein